MQQSIVMKHLPILFALGLGSALGARALAEPAQPKAWFDELPTHLTQDAGTNALRLDERVASKQLALARAEQRFLGARLQAHTGVAALSESSRPCGRW